MLALGLVILFTRFVLGTRIFFVTRSVCLKFSAVSYIFVTVLAQSMCTHPTRVTRFLAGKPKTVTVPCGKCDECLAKRRNEVALLTLLESEDYATLDFFTLTYDSERLPIALSECDESYRRIIGFERARVRPEKYGNGVRCAPHFNADYSLCYCPSLFPEDWRAHMHRFRAWCKRNSINTKFSFIQFGEYGELYHRPHYHCLFFGFTTEMSDKFVSLWESYFGHVDCVSVPRYNSDGSHAFLKLSKYISKYISKGKHLPSHVRAGFAVMPRRLSSIGFGRKNLDIDRLRSFILPTS